MAETDKNPTDGKAAFRDDFVAEIAACACLLGWVEVLRCVSAAALLDGNCRVAGLAKGAADLAAGGEN